VIFSFTDEWYKDGRVIEDWRFGLTTRARVPKPSVAGVQRAYRAVPHFNHSRLPLVSVVVASYNGARTLGACLESLSRLRYPTYEVILVDDGSTDETPVLAAQFPGVRCVRHAQNLGLSAARNTGIEAAQGEIVAFTDADCRVDEDWLHYLVGDLTRSRFAGIGGPNLLPAEDSCVAAVVQLSPGGPTHVMLTDQVAEHIPGCNMAFWKWALVEIGCFDPVFRQAGDDVDVCWRLQQRGHELGFSPAASVWHYRRSTVRAYLRQQHGYGEAEALLERKHPEYFSPLGGSMWRGRIYAPQEVGVRSRRPIIYYGLFGTGLFQSLYTTPSPVAPTFLTSLEYHVGVTLPLLVLAPLVPWLGPLGLASLMSSIGVCVAAGMQAAVPPTKQRFWSRPLVALLFALQPIVRGWARYQGRLFWRQTGLAAHETLESLSREQREEVPELLAYRAAPGFSRSAFLTQAVARLAEQGWAHRVDTGWNRFDLEVYGGRWCKLRLTTVAEITPDGDHVMRVRLRSALTLAARVGMGVLLGVVLLVLGLTGRRLPWLWSLLLALPAYVWWLGSQQSRLQRLIGVFVDRLAEEQGLTRREEAGGHGLVSRRRVDGT
jgi:GT2 family glycosyltransferase